MEYVDQSSGALRLCLTRGAFDYTQFTVLRETKVVWKDITVHIGILGESHYVLFEGSAHDQFHEICACTEIDTTHAQDVVQLDLLPNIANVQQREAIHGFDHAFSYQYQDYEQGMREMHDMTKHAEETDHITELSHVFPTNDGEDETAITKVFAEQGTGLSIQTFHSYPNEHIVVKTRSELIAHS